MFTSATDSLRWLSLLLLLLAMGCAGRSGSSPGEASLRKALTFHASFDRGSDADFAVADGWLYQAPAMDKWSEAKPGLPADGAIRVVPGEGKFGGALRFDRKVEPVVFYRAQGNVPWRNADWSGTISLWLRTDLERLAPGFCDPVQLTPRAWNDAAFFVEFERRERDVPFRLGAYADFKVWNPANREWSRIPPAERPLLTVDGPPFAGDRWTHVAFTWQRYNTGRADGIAVLYLDGAQVGALRNRTQTFTWDPAQTRLLLGLSYVGWIDDVAVFNRALDGTEIQQIRRLPRGIRSLLQP